MQGIDKIIEKIISDANADAEQTALQTQKQIDSVREKHEAQAKKQIEDLRREFAEKKSQVENRAETMAELEARRNMLSIKRELIDEAFSKAQDMIMSLPDEEYLGFVEKLMRNLDDKRGDVIVGKNEARINADFVDKINEKTDSAYKFSDERGNFEGGFILRTGRIETNCTVKMLVSQAKRGMEKKVASVLFEESGS